MKYITVILAFILTFIIIFTLNFNSTTNSVSASEFLRIHVRANSNSEIDQDVKYEIKDEIVNFLTPLICQCNSKPDIVKMLESNLNNIKNIADLKLESRGFNYESNVKITNENFPTRTYNNYTLDQGFYDCLLVELGEAVGDNWWCVIYPPLCFINYSMGNTTNVVYKSKIWEIINQFFS